MLARWMTHVKYMLVDVVPLASGADDPRAALKKLVAHSDVGIPMSMTAQPSKSQGRQTDSGANQGASGEPRMYVVILDELDQLLSNHQQVLYTLFEWAAAPRSRLILIGIANALDLTERFLPRLRCAGPSSLTISPLHHHHNPPIPSACVCFFTLAATVTLRARGATPETLNFTPYASDELSSILLQRLDPSNVHANDGEDRVPACRDALIDTNAVQFCCKKVANASGDARRALEVGNYSPRQLPATRPRLLGRPHSGSPCAFALQVTRVAVDKALDELNSSFGSLPLWADKPLIRFEHMSQALSAAFKSPVISLLASLPQVISRSHIH